MNVKDPRPVTPTTYAIAVDRLGRELQRAQPVRQGQAIDKARKAAASGDLVEVVAAIKALSGYAN